MNSENKPSSPSASVEDPHTLALPLVLSSSSSSLKPLRERNRTNLKRRFNLSRSQVFSNDFENDDHISTSTMPNKTITTAIAISNSQPAPSTPTSHTYPELYSKTVSPITPSPIHTTVTCSQVWERLASNEEAHTSTSPKPIIVTTTTAAATSSLPTHLSFSFEPSDDDGDDDDGENDVNGDKDAFQYVPVSSQSKLVQFQFITFARQQQLLFNDDEDHKVEEEEDPITDQHMDEYDEATQEQEQENRTCSKRKRSVSTTDSLDDISAMPMATNADAASSSSVTKLPCTKKPKIKDPNANFQLLNMRKKSFSHAKKHQFSKNKRNAFYRRTRHAGGNK